MAGKGYQEMVNDEITAIKERILGAIFPKKIYLFGSFARGTYTDESDYDFYIVVSDNAGDNIELSQKAYKSLRGIRKRPVDIVISHETVFNTRAQENTLEKIVEQEGILLYAE